MSQKHGYQVTSLADKLTPGQARRRAARIARRAANRGQREVRILARQRTMQLAFLTSYRAFLKRTAWLKWLKARLVGQ